MLEARDVSKTYKTESGLCDAVRGVSLAIEPGEFVAVVGRSGSGKSTLLAMLGGLCRPTSGTVAVGGVDLWSLREPERAAFHNRSVGLVFQFASLLPTLRVIDNVALPALVSGVIADDAYRRATELLIHVGLGDRAHAYPSELSGGEQRRAALARAIINAPPIVLADEPTSDLDEETEVEILDALGDIHRREGVALVIVTHDPNIAQRADRIVEIRNGSIVASRAGSNRLFETPSRRTLLVPHQDRAAEIPIAIPPAAVFEASARLGAGLGTWLISVSAWVVPAVLMALAVNQGVALYQRHLLHRQMQGRAALKDAALLWLRADLEDVTYDGAASYTLTLGLRNSSAANAVFVLAPTVRAYLQVGLTWQEILTRSIDGQEGRVAQIEGRRTYQFAFEPNSKEYTEQLSGYMHVRLTTSMLVSQKSVPGDDLVERVDDYYIHLKPPGADDAAILSKVKFPGKPPLWIPMPPH